MKRIIAYTQRVELIEAYGERRDAADQRISAFIYACGYLPLPLPNHLQVVRLLMDEFQLAGIVLTGGNNLCKYNGDAPERDETECLLLDIALYKNIPVLGFCRGMQIILNYFGNLIVPVVQHVAVQHEIIGKMKQSRVNSYHTMAAIEVKPPLQVLARTKDGVVEAIQHESKRILGIMWHPERNAYFETADIHMVKNLFGA